MEKIDKEIQPNPRLQAAIMEVLDNQLNDEDPPETKETYDRLMAGGIGKGETRRLISCALAAEIFAILKNQETFNLDRYIGKLNMLPKTPWLDEKDSCD